MPLRLPFAGSPALGSVALGLLLVLVSAAEVVAQGGCPPPPDPKGCWVDCGQCRGDLNVDGLLNELDLLIFELYREQQPQNPCANFNGNCDLGGFPIVDEFDRQILLCIINESDGACRVECGATTRDCLVEANPRDPDRGGCSNPTCCNMVCAAAPFCCEVLWDAQCVNIALNICYPDEPDTRADAGNCLCEHSYPLPVGNCVVEHQLPGCNDNRCSELVCECDPACCESTWDAACAQAAVRYCAQPCSNIVLSDMVCETLPLCCSTGEWDATCVFIAAQVIIQNPGLQLRAFPRQCLLCPPTDTYPDPACDSVGFRSLLCLIDPAYCDETAFDTELSECYQLVTENFPDCGIEWDADCAQIASRLCRWPEPGTRGLGNCLLPSTINRGCGDAYCSSLVCDCDPNCCDVVWDETCVALAGDFCILVPARDLAVPDLILPGGTSIEGEFGLRCGSPATDSCLYQTFTPFCENAACCQLVCGYDGFCCDNRWDTLCAKLATQVCDTRGKGICGPTGPNDGYPPPSGRSYRSCFVPRAIEFCQGYPDCSPAGCDNADCCNNVCYVDPYCCEIRWDDICADGAGVLCPEEYPQCGFILTGSCFIPHEMPYCDDGQCCENVCTIEPFCCTIEWDENCVVLAETECTQCGDIYSGSCLVAHPAPACYDEECCTLVCEIDSFCCTFTWDSSCATMALSNPAECGRTDACGDLLSRSCFISSYLPGCSDNLCCTEICKSYDPWCCEVRWDAVCAAQALSLCDPQFLIDGRDPCDEWHATPGCNVATCSAAVCSIPDLELCCTARWDTQCVEAALWLCQGLYECPGSGDCMRTNSTPMCDDPSCCNIVCTYDPLCCRDVWDNGCAVLAITTCQVPDDEPKWNCPCLGDCFQASTKEDPSPGCNDASCCAAVCAVTPECCIETWDEACVELAMTYCGGGIQCGSWTAGACLEPGDTPFCSDPACCQAVCVIEPYCCTVAWDSFCVSYAFTRCLRGCGLPTSGTCFYPKLTPGCDNAECCELICDEDPICCATVWDGLCAETAIKLCEPPECGEYAAGDCCEENQSPGCNDDRCCNAVCDEDPFCCDFTWDVECVNIARLLPTRCGCSYDCGDPCAGDCCLPNFTPSCNEAQCCDAVCADDPYCCDVMWDFTCASQVGFYAPCSDLAANPDAPCPAAQCGDPSAGGCCFPNGTPNCDDQACCDQICAVDPSCCDVAWDIICAEAANDPASGCKTCDGSDVFCGSPAAGDCCTVHNSPYCNNFSCCELVCLFDELCCIGTWDELCVALAQQNCPGCQFPFAPPK